MVASAAPKFEIEIEKTSVHMAATTPTQGFFQVLTYMDPSCTQLSTDTETTSFAAGGVCLGVGFDIPVSGTTYKVRSFTARQDAAGAVFYGWATGNCTVPLNFVNTSIQFHGAYSKDCTSNGQGGYHLLKQNLTTTVNPYNFNPGFSNPSIGR